MIQVPEVGFNYSATKSNIEINALADWLECIVLFDQKRTTKSDVVDILIEYQICPDSQQDLAHDIASSGWRQLETRKHWGGLPATFSISSSYVEDATDWSDDLLRAFFLMLSLFRIFPDWASSHRDHVGQGNLFEEVVELICPALLPGWEVFRAGWSPGEVKDIPEIVEALCERVNVQGALDIEEWHAPNAKDAGLDIVCYRPFRDAREALPVYFLQCASGKNWREKVGTPNADLWQKLMNSAVRPSTGIAAPFVIDDKELRIAALTGQTTVFDRLRMLSSAFDGDIELSQSLADRLMAWMAPRVEALPLAD